MIRVGARGTYLLLLGLGGLASLFAVGARAQGGVEVEGGRWGVARVAVEFRCEVRLGAGV